MDFSHWLRLRRLMSAQLSAPLNALPTAVNDWSVPSMRPSVLAPVPPSASLPPEPPSPWRSRLQGQEETAHVLVSQ